MNVAEQQSLVHAVLSEHCQVFYKPPSGCVYITTPDHRRDLEDALTSLKKEIPTLCWRATEFPKGIIEQACVVTTQYVEMLVFWLKDREA
jgi:hypothetical protein